MVRQEWKKRYINRLVKKGLTEREALENYAAGGFDEHDPIRDDIDPEQAADDEIYYYMADS